MGQATDEVRSGKQLAQHGKLCRMVEAAFGPRSLLPGSRFLVVAPSLVLLDAARDAQGAPVGDSCRISHLMTNWKLPRRIDLARALAPARRPVGTYALVCPMAMDRALGRNQQDIVTVAVELEHQMPVELWLQSSFERARDAFSAKHIAWLHLDTHGGADGHTIMLGASRDGGRYADAGEVPRIVRPPLIVACGCALNGSANAIGSTLHRRGAESVFGPCTTFQSLGVANSEQGEAKWYRSFFTALAAGSDVGSSLAFARRSVPGGLLKYAWVIIGSSQLSFSPELNFA